MAQPILAVLFSCSTVTGTANPGCAFFLVPTYLIDNLLRLVLTIAVAAGSYAAFAFLVAAKGLIRSEDLRDRDFAEYFLIGSLTSVLVALCAGLVMRFALWPQLFFLHFQ